MDKEERQIYRFDSYSLDAQGRVLLRDGAVVHLTPKAMDALLILVRNPGLVVEKERLLKEVWAEAFVEEGSLTRTIHELRRVLKDSSSRPTFIETITKRGYRFVAPVQCQTLAEVRDELIIERHVHARVTTREEEAATTSGSRWRDSINLHKWLIVGGLAVVASAAVIYAVWLRPARRGSALAIKTVAVLPLKSLDANERDAGLGLKLADAIIQRLGRLEQIVIRPTRAVQKYDGETLDPVAAGREQQVDVVLDGSFQRDERRLRLRVQLLRVSDGQQMWASTFDERSTDPFYLEDALAEQAARALLPQLSSDERQLVVRHDTENAEANRLYSEGRYYWNKRTEQGFARAIEFFDQAVAKDPGYALAYAGLADCYALLSVWGGRPANEALMKARAAALQATTLDPKLAEAHTSLAFAKWIYDRDWAGAEAEFRQAIALNLRYPTAHQWYAYFLAAMERFDEAIGEIKQARDLDELSPGIDTDVGEIYCWARRYDDAIAQLQSVLNNEPNFPPARNILGMTYIKQGRWREGVAELEAARRLDNSPRILSALGCAYGLSGSQEQARSVLGELDALSKQRYVSPFARALVEVGLGNKQQAFAFLEGAFNEHSDSIVILKVYPWLDTLRSDPRFTDLCRRVGLNP